MIFMCFNEKEQLLKYDRAVPRYTSYPTVPHFKPVIVANDYMDMMGACPGERHVSLYLHIPFCSKLCWFCGCNTQITHRYAPVENYMQLLMREIKIAADFFKIPRTVSHIHFGGGSPTILSASDFLTLIKELGKYFNILHDAKIAIEVDPRRINEAKVAAYAKSGINRVSIGVQDFDDKVLQSVNRAQPFHLSYEAIKLFREYGIFSVNIDLMYGLPFQTIETMRRTAEYALLLDPDRIALFGYAHVPWMKKHMRLIPSEALPAAEGRLGLFDAASEIFTKNGYVPVGIDHFSKPSDSLAKAAAGGNLHRNFQGYTEDDAEITIGLGVSAISKFPGGFIQNSTQMPAYRERILTGNLAVEKYCPLTAEDKLRQEVIQSLMCNFTIDLDSVCKRHGFSGDFFDKELQELQPLCDSGLVDCSGGHFIKILKPQAARLVCANFDAYLQSTQTPRHASSAT